jgi:acyl-CoA dehydrogenase
LGKCLAPPSDHLGHQVSSLLLQPGAARDRLTNGIYVPIDENDAVGALEASLLSTLKCEPLQAKVEAARKAGKITAREELACISEACDKAIINATEVRLLEHDYALRRKVIMVDDFAPEELSAAKTLH